MNAEDLSPWSNCLSTEHLTTSISPGMLPATARASLVEDGKAYGRNTFWVRFVFLAILYGLVSSLFVCLFRLKLTRIGPPCKRDGSEDFDANIRMQTRRSLNGLGDIHMLTASDSESSNLVSF